MQLGACEKELASVIIGASKLEQLKENLRAVDHLDFSDESLEAINLILNQ